MSDAVASPVVFPIQMGGLNSLAPASMVYPDALTATNVRWGRSGQLLKRSGFTTYNSTAMPATTRAITGISQFNRRDTTTRYTIVGTQDKLFVAPTSGAWTTLVSGLTASATDYWDFAVFNNELIGVNGVDAPQVTDGTAANTGALTASTWQLRTSAPLSVIGQCGMVAIDLEDELWVIGGDGSRGSVQGNTNSYDPSTDSWRYGIKQVVPRSWGQLGQFGGRIYNFGGSSTDSDVLATSELYDPSMEIWRSITNLTAARVGARGISVNNKIYVACGSSAISSGTVTAASAVSTNYGYDPITDTYTTYTAWGTAKSNHGAFNISTRGYTVGGYNTAGARITTLEGYDPFADTLTSIAEASLATANAQLDGTSGRVNGFGYAIGGNTAAGSVSTSFEYDPSANSWSTNVAMNTDRDDLAVGTSGYFLYAFGGGSTSKNSIERRNLSTAAPIGLYVESFKGRVFIARTSSYPSRVFYSTVGNAREWDTFNFIDVDPDNGDWITGMFVFDGRLYVTKTDTIYQISFRNLDPEEGDQEIITLENVKGCVSNRSIVVTDMGVFYLAEDGFRLFDGARSVLIGEKIQVTLDGYVQSRLKYTAGVWLRAQDEIWWSVTSTGSTHNTILCYNYRHKRWSLYSGIAAESVAAVEDANDIDQILFGTGAASDGKLYKGNTTDADNGAAISATYQTGWFSPVSGLNQFIPKGLYGWANRSGNWSLTIATRARYGTANLTSDAVNLLSGTYPDAFFQDATDQRFHIQLGSGGQDLTGHAHSLVLTNANASEPFVLHGLVMTGDHSVSGGTFPV